MNHSREIAGGSSDGVFRPPPVPDHGDGGAYVPLAQASTSQLSSCESDGDYLSEIFKVLSNVELSSTQALHSTLALTAPAELPGNSIESRRNEEIEEDCGSFERKQVCSRKRIRTAEEHKVYEKRLRERLKEKMKALQELIPNCDKLDAASVLDEAIGYVKTLQQQIISPSEGAKYQFPYMAPSGIGMGVGLATVGSCYSTRIPFFAAPFLNTHSLLPGAASFPGISGVGMLPLLNLPLPMNHMPIIPAPALPPINVSSVTPPSLVAEMLPKADTLNRAETSSKKTQNVLTDSQKVQMLSQAQSIPTGSTSTNPMKLIPPSFSSGEVSNVSSVLSNIENFDFCK